MKQIQKITDAQIASKGVISLSDRPNALQQYGGEGLSPVALKQRFDKLAAFIAEKLNEISDVLSSDEAADYIRIALDEMNVTSLNELITSMVNGSFARKILFLAPSASPSKAVTLQVCINDIARDISALQEKDEELQESIDTEKTRAEGAEKTLQDKIDGEQERAEGVERTLQENIGAEKTRAEGAEDTLGENINAEKSRAELAEEALGKRITDETANQAKTNKNNNFTAGQTINGDLTVNGHITQIGASYESHAEQMYTKDDKIILRDGATGGLGNGEYAGVVAKKYDGDNDGHLVFGSDGIARVGDVGDEQPLATRAEKITDGNIVKWDAKTRQFVDSDEKIEDKADKTELKKLDEKIPKEYIKSVLQTETSDENGGVNVLSIFYARGDVETLRVRNGRSGVYVGSGPMPDDCNVQIDPDGSFFKPEDFIGAPGAAYPIVNIPFDAIMTIPCNSDCRMGVIEAACEIKLGKPIEGRSCEWIFTITQGGAPYTVALPDIEFPIGIAPTFSIGTTRQLRLYRVGDTLKGVWS